MQQHKQSSAQHTHTHTHTGSANKIFADLSFPLSTSIPKAGANETKRSDAACLHFKLPPDEPFGDKL